MILKPLLVTLMVPQLASAVTFVFGDAFASNGTGSADNPSQGTNGFAGNQITTVYRVSDGVPGNPFNGGNAGGDFSPIVVGEVFGTQYRTTSTFDLSEISPAPAGFEYQITDITLFLEVSDTAEQDGADATVNVFANLGITTGTINATPSASLTIPENASNGDFFSASLPTSAVDLNTADEFTFTLDIANATQGVRLGSDLSTPEFPNVGINGTEFAQVAPRLIINADLVAVPEPSTSTALLVGLTGMLFCRRRVRRA